MFRFFRLILVAVLTIIIVCATSVAAFAGEEISILDNSTEIHFPGALVFKITVQSSSDVTSIRLNHKVEKMNYAQVIGESWPNFTPATNIKTSWIWDMRRASLPPEAEVEYWWIVENRNGDRFVTDIKTVNFSDNNHLWQKVISGKLSLNWYEGDEAFANELLSSAINALDRLAEDTGVELEKSVKIYVYNGSDDLQKSMISPREWTGGVAFTEYSTIAIGIATNNLKWGRGALAHELGHMVIHQITYSPYGVNLPTWLDEGLAMYAEGSSDSYLQSFLKKAVEKNDLISLRSLTSPFSAKTQKALLSYAESQSVVEFLINKYGKGKILELLTTFKEGATFDDALMEIYGFDQDDLETLWIDFLTTSISTTKTVHNKEKINLVLKNTYFPLNEAHVNPLCYKLFKDHVLNY